MINFKKVFDRKKYQKKAKKLKFVPPSRGIGFHLWYYLMLLNCWLRYNLFMTMLLLVLKL